MLDPFSALGKPGHAAAEELLRGIIEICLAVPRPQGGPGGAPFGGMGAGPGAGEEPVFESRDTTLARKIADEKSVRTLLDWVLAGQDEVTDAAAKGDTVKHSQGGAQEDAEEATPVPPSVEERKGAAEEDVIGADEGRDEQDDDARQRELRTSSLISSLAVFTELIRKNNSDFVEQQMLTWARRRQAAQAERELLEADGAEIVRDPRDEEEERLDDKGPSVVDLGTMLSLVARRIGEFQQLVKKPRSSTAPVRTAGGMLSPLTLERFRICEFYAELLHCSNMSLLNRTDRSAALYDASGHLARGFDAADELAAALAAPGQSSGDDELDLPRGLQSPEIVVPSDFSTSPNDHSFGPYSGMSTPSGRESLDEESGGVLTKAEAKELKAIIAAAGKIEEEEEGRSRDAAAGEQVDEATTPRAATSDAAKRDSRTSNGSSLRDEHDLPPTPSVYSVASRQLPAVPLPPGPLLKSKFLEHGVIPTMLGLFFEYPWHNFLHNVVFDLVQQIFHGRLDRTLDRQLAESVFTDGKLCERILEGQKANDVAAAARTNMRLGYMSHLVLIAEETVKLFERFPELHQAVEASIPQPAWDTFVSTTLREARERETAPLGGGRAGLNLSVDKAPSSSSLSDEDDEFPMNSARAMRAMDAAGLSGSANAGGEGAGAGFGKLAATAEAGGAGGVSDQFSRYLADALTSDRAVGSSDEDDEDDNWLGGSRFDPGDVDFELDVGNRSPRTFGFDDRFDAAGPSSFGSHADRTSDDDAEWAPFGAAKSGSSASDAFGSDDFTPTVASSTATSRGGFSSFAPAFDGDFAPASTSSGQQGDDDDFGDFEGGDSSDPFAPGTLITLPPMDAFDDFDFGEETRPGGPPAASFGGAVDRPPFHRGSTEEDDGSDRFGRLSLGDVSDPGSPDKGESKPLPSLDDAMANSGDDVNGSTAADRATSPTEPLGPALHPGAHLTQDGMIEVEVEGRTVRAPADDIVLAHRRNSLDGSQGRPSFEKRRSSSLERSAPSA